MTPDGADFSFQQAATQRKLIFSQGRQTLQADLAALVKVTQEVWLRDASTCCMSHPTHEAVLALASLV